MGTFDVSCGMFCEVIITNITSLVLRDSDTDSENISLMIWHAVSDGQKKMQFKGAIIDRYIIN